MTKKTGAKKDSNKDRTEKVHKGERRDQVCVSLFLDEVSKIDAFRKSKHPGISRSRVIRYYALKGMGVAMPVYKRGA